MRAASRHATPRKNHSRNIERTGLRIRATGWSRTTSLDFGNPSRIRTRRRVEHSLGVAPRFAWVAATCLCYLGDECMSDPRENRTPDATGDNRAATASRYVSQARLLRKSNPSRADRQSANVTRRIRRQMEGEIGFEPITVRFQRPTFYQLNYSPLRSRAGTGGRSRTLTVGFKDHRPAFRRTPARRDDDVMKRKTRKTRLALACRRCAAAVFTHTTPVPSSPSISPVQYT